MSDKYFTDIDLNGTLNKASVPAGMFKHIRGFEVVSFKRRASLKFKSADCEVGIMVLKGSCSVSIDGKTYDGIGGRKDVFSGAPAAIYVPPGKEYELSGEDAELALCSASCAKGGEFTVISPDKVQIMQVGKGNWHREVHMVIGPKDSPSENLLLGETINPGGNWSGTPPHKHERNELPEESFHEELYYFRYSNLSGYGIERFYSPERGFEELIPLKNNRVTFMPWGYHQIVSGPGYDLYYLFFLSGEGKKLTGYVDPEHKWINQ